METVIFEKMTVLCTFCLPHKNKKRPRKGRFLFCYKNFATSVFRTSGLLQVFFVQEFCHKYFSYKCFATSVFAGKSFATSVVIQLFTHKSFAKHQASPKLFLQRRCFHTRQVLSVARRTFRVLMPCNNISRKVVGNGFLRAKGVSGLAESAKHLCKASVTLLLNFVFLYGCITNLYVYCDALSLTKQFVFL